MATAGEHHGGRGWLPAVDRPRLRQENPLHDRGRRQAGGSPQVIHHVRDPRVPRAGVHLQRRPRQVSNRIKSELIKRLKSEIQLFHTFALAPLGETGEQDHGRHGPSKQSLASGINFLSWLV